MSTTYDVDSVRSFKDALKEGASINDALYIQLGDTTREPKHLNLPGLKWIGTINISGHGSVTLPDLLLIGGELTIDEYQTQLIVPKLVEIAESIFLPEVPSIEDRVYNAGCFDEEFGVVTRADEIYSFGKRGYVPDKNLIHNGSKVVVRNLIDDCDDDNEEVFVIANDGDYALYYNAAFGGKITAGCREFYNINEAIAHWDARSESEFESAANRGLMFAFALQNLKDELNRNKKNKRKKW